MPKQQQQQQQRRHVFLFRHCVRSVDNTIKLSNENATGAAGTINPLDYLPPELPAWNTPALWCTAVGADIIKGTGAHVLRRYLLLQPPHTDNDQNDDENDADDDAAADGTTTTTRIKVAFIADNTPRDIQTAFAMMSGMAGEVVSNSSSSSSTSSSLQHLDLEGLDNIQIDPRLFHPMQPNKNLFNNNNNNNNDKYYDSGEQQQDAIVCATPPVQDQIQAIEQRFQNVPPPGNFSIIVDWMEQQTGHKFHVPTNNNNSDRTSVVLALNGTHFQWPFDLVKYVAETVFYARASGIDDDDYYYWNKNISMDQLYELVAWIHWSRHILNVGNNQAAANGAVLMARILQALALQEDTQNNNDNNNNDGGSSVDATFIIGHDGDLDAVTTALAMSWNLPFPYHQGYTPTPPGSALHFSNDGSNIEISVLAPIYFTSKNPQLNTTGILEEVPVIFSDLDVEVRGKASVIGSIDGLRERIQDTIGMYPGAMECFVAAKKIWPSHKDTSSIAMIGSEMLFLGGGILLGAVVACGYNRWRCRRHRRYHRNYSEQLPCDTGLDLELT